MSDPKKWKPIHISNEVYLSLKKKIATKKAIESKVTMRGYVDKVLRESLSKVTAE